MVAGLRAFPASPPSLVGYCSALCESGSDLLGTAPSNMPRRRTPPRLPTFFLDRLLEGFHAEIDNPTDEPEGEVTQ